ncbi:tRNA dihydrouridine(20/20a) synthase DusA [Prosthecodimorpha staleyi]|uniref:tRNA-dihydrouridine(20/20a) synthase n=1 Tax=Prosthecodimorpha staleyi TaxID=2840188 RepID=A0A947GIY5_9HYPH|nr:tRNA dihydrouridine(20/20a) synthase DusA [Prosthecodimorpha staleyi]MBT9290539.1 tRNA dihydrouridine(20/20a) synthase DusA [Prosthecodimorpha staleyi]
MSPNSRFSVAPMMDWTDRHCRVFHRLLSGRALLYTEMVTTGAILHGDREKLLGFSPAEHPVALQLGGSEPSDLAAAARIGADWGYDEINLNCGCPSDRVQSGRFGACLMAEPAVVADAVAAMKAAVGVPVTVKCRIGIDHQDPEESLPGFVDAVAAAGADLVVVHARKAWLDGLSPKENRTVPPLDYPLVYRLKADRPDLPIVLNGGLGDLDQATAALARVDGVMLGRAAYEHPRLLAAVDRRVFGEDGPDADPFAVAERMVPYAESVVARGFRLSNVTRHMLGLFNGWPGARAWRRLLTVESVKPGADPRLILDALALVRRPEPQAATSAADAVEAATDAAA